MEDRTVTLKGLVHKGADCIGIYCTQSGLHSGVPVNHYLKKAEAKWSRSNKCWYVPCTKKNYELLAGVLKGIVVLEVTQLKKYLLEKKKNTVANTHSPPVDMSSKKIAPQKVTVQNLKHAGIISKENDEALHKFKQHLVLKSYSASTVKTYTNEFTQFLHTVKK